MMITPDGPWHEGFAYTTELGGKYVTVLCGDADTAAAICEVVADGGRYWGPRSAAVGSLSRPPDQPCDSWRNPVRKRLP